MVDHSLKGKTVLIAGGAKNLGGLIARDLAAAGAKAIAIHYNSAHTQPEGEKQWLPYRPKGLKPLRFKPT